MIIQVVICVITDHLVLQYEIVPDIGQGRYNIGVEDDYEFRRR